MQSTSLLSAGKKDDEKCGNDALSSHCSWQLYPITSDPLLPFLPFAFTDHRPKCVAVGRDTRGACVCSSIYCRLFCIDFPLLRENNASSFRYWRNVTYWFVAKSFDAIINFNYDLIANEWHTLNNSVNSTTMFRHVPRTRTFRSHEGLKTTCSEPRLFNRWPQANIGHSWHVPRLKFIPGNLELRICVLNLIKDLEEVDKTMNEMRCRLKSARP